MNLHRDIAALHRAYRGGDVLPSAMLDNALARIAASRLNAFADLDRAGAEAAAAASDARVRRGDLRPLEGVTIGIKSNIAVAGLPWTGGMGLRRAIVADRDATVVARLRAAGAIILGTLGMHEAALGATSDNHWFGRIENPHGRGRTPGGSSGGSGAAVAAGLCQAALGTDTLGSVRIPAAYNGVYGLKPTHGAVSDDGLVFLDRSLDSIGPLARSIDDLAAIWGVLRDPGAAVRASGGRLARVVVLADPGDVEPAVRSAYDRAVAVLDLPRDTLALADALPVIRLAGFIQAGRALDRDLAGGRTDLSPELIYMLDFCAQATPQPAVLERTRAALLAAIGDDGVLLLPTAPQAAFAHGRAPATQADFTGLANIAGLPALSLPAGRDAHSMPVAVQLVGPSHSEDALIGLARTLDAGLHGYAPPPGF